MRIRAIKPDFFKDEKLSDLPLECSILFAGLWCMADREGRLEDRPRRIKAEVFPYRDVDVESLLEDLAKAGFITRYAIGDLYCIEISSFLRHQIPSRDEAQSDLPSPKGKVQRYVRPPNETVRFRLYQRDNFTCVYCGFDMHEKVRARSLDHVVPYAQGGSNEENNLVTACKRCNTAKADRDPTEAGLPWPKGFGHKRKNVNHPSIKPEPPINTPVNPPVNRVGHVGKGKGKRKGNGKEEETGAPNAPLSEPEVLPENRTNKPPHVEFVDRFKVAYEGQSGQPFKYGTSQFVLAKKLIETYGYEMVVSKVKILGKLCRDKSAWFTKAGWADFTIEKISSHWNSLIPEAIPLTKEQEFQAEVDKRRLESERINRVMDGGGAVGGGGPNGPTLRSAGQEPDRGKEGAPPGAVERVRTTSEIDSGGDAEADDRRSEVD